MKLNFAQLPVVIFLIAFSFCFWSMVVRPTMPETTALGAAMAAGMAKGVDVWTINPEDKSQINTDVFEPAVDPHGKSSLNLVG